MEDVDADATADTSVESLQAVDLLSLLDLAAPVSRGAILERAAELSGAHQDDPATEKVIRRAGERLAVMAAQNATGMLILDEEGGRDVPLMEPGDAVQEFATLQAQPVYPQTVVEGMLNPIRRRVLSTCILVECTPTVAAPPPTPLQLARGYGVDITFQQTNPPTKPGFSTGGAYTVDATTVPAAVAPVPSTMVNLLEAGQSNSGPFLGGPPPSGTNPDGSPIGRWPTVNGNPVGGMLPTAALIKQTKIQQAAAALGCELPPGTPSQCASDTANPAFDPTTSMAGVPALSTPADHTLTFPARFNKVLSIRLKQFTFPNSLYNVGGCPCGVSACGCPTAEPSAACCAPGRFYEGAPAEEGSGFDVWNTVGEAMGEAVEDFFDPGAPADAASTDGAPAPTEVPSPPCEPERQVVTTVPAPLHCSSGLASPALPHAVCPGSYTFETLASAIEEATALSLKTYKTRGGYVWFARDPVDATDTSDSWIAFPAVCEPAGGGKGGDVVVCQPGGASSAGSRRVASGGVADLLGFANPAFSFPEAVPVQNTSAFPASWSHTPGSTVDPPAATVRPLPLPAQAVLPPLDSTNVYIAVNDFTHNSYPTFVGQTGDSILPGDIIGEATIPNGQFGTTTVVGDHLATGLPYSLRTYFGQVTLERLRVQVLGKDGKPVDTRGSSFSLVLELEQLYNV